MNKSEFYKIRRASGVASVIKNYENCAIGVDDLIDKLSLLDPIFIFENLMSSDNSTNYSMFGLETIDINVEHIEEYYEKKNAFYDCSNSKSPFTSGVIGYINYDAIEDFYDIKIKNISSIPKYEFKLAKLLIVINHTDSRLHVICNSFEKEEVDEDIFSKSYEIVIEKVNNITRLIYPELEKQKLNYKKINRNHLANFEKNENQKYNLVRFRAVNSKERFIKNVEIAKEHIENGDIFQVVLSEKYSAKVQIDKYELYKNLKNINKSEYKSLINFNEITTICTSPETLVKNNNNIVETFPIAGTRAVKNDGRDLLREKELENDEKELSEHLMLVDLGRNDISKVCKAGSVRVKEFCKIKRFSRVMHLVSRVVGEAEESIAILDSIKATFPAGTVTGAPKLRAMQIIDELETCDRALYAGAIVLIDDKANLDSCITIRTIQIKDDELIIQAGAGIVKDSVAEHEYTEILNKSKAMFEAVEMTCRKEYAYDFNN